MVYGVNYEEDEYSLWCFARPQAFANRNFVSVIGNFQVEVNVGPRVGGSAGRLIISLGISGRLVHGRDGRQGWQIFLWDSRRE